MKNSDLDGNLHKKITILLIDKSELLTRSCCFTISSKEIFTKEKVIQVAPNVGHGFGSVANQILKQVGSDFYITSHHGGYNSSTKATGFTSGPTFEPGTDREIYHSTFWISPKMYDHTADRLIVTPHEILSVNL